jgi:hypothetical protein
VILISNKTERDNRLEYRIKNHRDCRACGRDGFYLRGFCRTEDGGMRAPIVLSERSEGWLGIPHGGFGMGAILELFTGINNYPSRTEALYPLMAKFRLGGTSPVIGDRITVTVSPVRGGGRGSIVLRDEDHPYLSADIFYKRDNSSRREMLQSYLPESFSCLESSLVPLPYSRRCLVCGTKRDVPGFRRRFHLIDGSDGPVVVSHIGFDPEGDRELFQFHRRGTLLNGVLAAILDENMGWAGFFLSKNGGVSVRLEYNFYRDVMVGERIVTFGRGEAVKGDIARRMMFFGSGGAAVARDDGSLEVVAVSYGQFLAVPRLTKQMRERLIPAKLSEHAFAIAESTSRNTKASPDDI